MAKKPSFETALRRLEEITSELEQGDPSLEKSLKTFDEGVELVKFCNAKLEEAHKKVDLLIKQNDTLQSIDFSGDEDGDPDLS